MYKVELTEEILKKYIDILPISYYLGRKINIGITNDSASYHSPLENLIRVSLPQINKLTYKTKPTKRDIERGIRTLLYHEISHAILTPCEKTQINHTMFNVFEDERIETLLGNYYRDVDFKDFVRRINDYDPSIDPKNEFEYFYRVVRFRDGEETLVDRVERIINDARFISSNTFQGENGYSFIDYQEDIDKLYKDCTDYFLAHYERVSEPNLDDNVEVIIITKDSINSEDIKQGIKFDTNGRKVKVLIDPSVEDDIKELLDDVLGFSKSENLKTGYDQDNIDCTFKSKIREIISRVKDRGKKIGNTLNTYSGRLTPRLTINNDYKWFKRENMGEDRGEVGQLVLNLFIDVSGSFIPNEAKMNGILEELENLETELKNKFKFNLITMGYSINHIKENRRISCSGGTILDLSWKDTYDMVQDSRNKCINIIMFDGECFDNSNAHVFSIFDGNRNTIISDISNSSAINRYCTNAKHIYLSSNLYTSKIEESILETLSDYIR